MQRWHSNQKLIALKYNSTIETFYSEELNKEIVNNLEQLKKETFINNIKEVNKILKSQDGSRILQEKTY